MGPQGEARVLFEGGGGSADNFNSPQYLGDRTHNTTEPHMQYLVPENTTFTKLVCRTQLVWNGNQAGTTVFRLRVNGVNTSLICTATANGAGFTGSGSVPVQAGDVFSITADADNSSSRYVWWALY